MKLSTPQGIPTALQAGIFILLMLLLSLPAFISRMPEADLDSSWQLAISLAWEQGRVWGRDFHFNYGALGWLATRIGLRDVVYHLLFFDAILLVALAWVMWQSLRRGASGWVYGAWALGFGLAANIFYSLTGEVVFVWSWLMLYALLRYTHIGKWYFLALAGIAATLMCFIKANLSLVMLLLWGLAWAWGIWRYIAQRGILAVMLVAMLGALLGIARALHTDFVPFMVYSLDIARSYQEAMVWELGLKEYLLAPMLIGLMYALAVWAEGRNYWREGDSRSLVGLSIRALAIGILLGVMHKQSFVRADIFHYTTFFKFAAAFVALHYLAAAPNTVGARVWGRATWGSLLVCWVFVLSGSMREEILSAARLSNWWRYTQQAFSPSIHTAHRPSISDSLRRAIGNAPVDVVPWAGMQAYTNGLHYQPRPIPQSYAAHSIRLAAANAQAYSSTNTAPSYVFIAHRSIDERNPLWDDAALKYVLLTHYRLVYTAADIRTLADSSQTRILLQRRKEPLSLTTTKTTSLALAWDKWLDIPQDAPFVHLRANIEYAMLGKIRGILFQYPSFEVVVENTQGETFTYKGIRPLWEAGGLVSHDIGSDADLAKFFGDLGKKNIRLKRIKFISNMPQYFQPSISAELQHLSIP